MKSGCIYTQNLSRQLEALVRLMSHVVIGVGSKAQYIVTSLQTPENTSGGVNRSQKNKVITFSTWWLEAALAPRIVRRADKY